MWLGSPVERARIRVVGMVGPRGDGYRSDGPVEPTAAQRYHQAQADAFAEAAAGRLLRQLRPPEPRRPGARYGQRLAGTRVGVRGNASRRSHADLDEAPDLDEGDPRDCSDTHTTLLDAFPNLDVLGGCCGTDVRHVAQLWRVPELVASS
jgi:S-methylmethionine-dependent homocysteine/selenocysteine methylase